MSTIALIAYQAAERAAEPRGLDSSIPRVPAIANPTLRARLHRRGPLFNRQEATMVVDPGAVCLVSSPTRIRGETAIST